MRQYKRTIMTITFMVILILSGIRLTHPLRIYGQMKERADLSREGVRDPFLLPSGVYLLSKTGPSSGVRQSPSGANQTSTEDLMKVKAIVISDHVQLALIDRHIVTIGDSIRGEKVLEIQSDRVTLGKGDQKRTLFLFQSPVRVTVEENPPHSYAASPGGSEGRGEGEQR